MLLSFTFFHFYRIRILYFNAFQLFVCFKTYIISRFQFQLSSLQQPYNMLANLLSHQPQSHKSCLDKGKDTDALDGAECFQCIIYKL